MIHRRRWAGAALFYCALALVACGEGANATAPAPEGSSLRYLALGDSYTIGTSVAERERWPNQLDARVPELELVGNLAVNGYTSADLIEEELPEVEAYAPEVVSVLIGVNDVVQGVPESRYAANVAVILDELLTRLPPDRIICVATPDYTVTPSGGSFGDPVQQREGIVGVNAILHEACESRAIHFVPEIFEISRAARDDPSLVADDGLHPSGAQYSRWVDAIAPVVEDLVGR